MPKREEQSPATPKQKWKQSAGYMAGSGGSDYAKKKKRQSDGEQDSVLEKVTTGLTPPRPQKTVGPTFEALVAAFEKSSVHDAESRPFNWEAACFTTPAFNGAANSRLEIPGVRFPDISGVQASQPCFVTATRDPGFHPNLWEIKRHVGYVRDGIFKGRVDQADILQNPTHIVEDLATWAAAQRFKVRNPT